MSIRAIATELYRAQKKVEELEKQLEEAPLREKDPIRKKLQQAQQALQQMRRMLDGAKTPSPFTSKFSFFKK